MYMLHSEHNNGSLCKNSQINYNHDRITRRRSLVAFIFRIFFPQNVQSVKKISVRKYRGKRMWRPLRNQKFPSSYFFSAIILKRSNNGFVRLLYLRATYSWIYPKTGKKRTKSRAQNSHQHPLIPCSRKFSSEIFSRPRIKVGHKRPSRVFYAIRVKILRFLP